MTIKRYYWLKLYKDFFNDDLIKNLKKKDRGYTYIVIYTKLLLLSLEDEGHLFFESVEDSFNEELALKIDEDPTDVKTTVEYLIDKGLLEIKADDEYFFKLNIW
ncbi:phage replisome organizer, putative, N-terminal region [Peptoniphilus asaccharolyticus DSM 20463]|uniref:Phage replisome organizer, putative, N-terminal region n=1 Tax=Peptoniphilus asaccharolyticus DSM 20463 TaxID=573058 RepID=A0A1W1V9X8_PEPAS|nr:phage replisome organizer N-terminal domain-containing protein [Peptoniphilus asaccharolyticus]MBL7575759.1 phage replisome organizer N-terminal domain-containing protein [Peptoniphilus asaccharolyticus]SMB90105.1 phage replisome organizer, putative, N-terminal region [Peptoniphilus asaccharolyticus DSM 20463]